MVSWSKCATALERYDTTVMVLRLSARNYVYANDGTRGALARIISETLAREDARMSKTMMAAVDAALDVGRGVGARSGGGVVNGPKLDREVEP